jgi:hypothetical protein
MLQKVKTIRFIKKDGSTIFLELNPKPKTTITSSYKNFTKSRKVSI